MEKCRQCPFNSVNAKLEGYETNRTDAHCTKCLCNLHLKTRALSAQCPEKFWLKETTQKEEKEITKYLNDESNK